MAATRFGGKALRLFLFGTCFAMSLLFSQPQTEEVAKPGTFSAPVPIYKPDPEYSEEARNAGLEGMVVLQAIVDSTGRVRDIRVVRSLGLGLDEKAIEALNKWKFRPGHRRGEPDQPVAVRATFEMNFNCPNCGHPIPDKDRDQAEAPTKNEVTTEKNEVTTEGTVAEWAEGNGYSSHFLYNGYTYRTISIFDVENPAASITVSVSPAAKIPCPPGKGLFAGWGRCGTALMNVRNDGTIPFDFDPTRFRCVCQAKKPYTLRYRAWPDYLSKAKGPPPLLGNTMEPGRYLSGLVFFDGACGDAQQMLFVLPIKLGGKSWVFTFPFD